MDNIWIIEDEQAISELIRLNLNLAGYGSRQASTGSEALSMLALETPALVLLDVMLPDRDGFELMDEFRERAIPVIFLTARNGLADKVRGLKLGADDYIVKPFETIELLARIETVLRRYDTRKSSLTYGDIVIDLDEHKVKQAGQPVELTLKEYDLLLLLVRNRNKALSREKILELVWTYDFTGETRTVDIHIQKLRKKLSLEERIKTVYKFGYRLEDKP